MNQFQPVPGPSQAAFDSLSEQMANIRTLRTRVTFTATTGNAIAHFPGSGTANMGIANVDVQQYVPTGGILVAIIPGQTTRDYGQDYAFVTLSDSNSNTVRIVGSPNKEYSCNCDILYRMY